MAGLQSIKIKSGIYLDILGSSSNLFKNGLDLDFISTVIDSELKDTKNKRILVDFSAPQSWYRIFQYINFSIKNKYDLSYSFQTDRGDRPLFLSSSYRKFKALQSVIFCKILQSKQKKEIYITNLIEKDMLDNASFLSLKEGVITWNICNVEDIKDAFILALRSDAGVRKVRVNSLRKKTKVLEIEGRVSKFIFGIKTIITRSILINGLLIDAKRFKSKGSDTSGTERAEKVYMLGGLGDYYISTGNL